MRCLLSVLVNHDCHTGMAFKSGDYWVGYLGILLHSEGFSFWSIFLQFPGTGTLAGKLFSVVLRAGIQIGAKPFVSDCASWISCLSLGLRTSLSRLGIRHAMSC
jgi:hypothetical protein